MNDLKQLAALYLTWFAGKLLSAADRLRVTRPSLALQPDRFRLVSACVDVYAKVLSGGDGPNGPVDLTSRQMFHHQVLRAFELATLEQLQGNTDACERLMPLLTPAAQAQLRRGRPDTRRFWAQINKAVKAQRPLVGAY